ncbi:ATP-binding cassette domain-containing protein [Oscillibacter sp. CU971]|uniref:ATP-binding cassette domain-containing protein n=1 Tax=Oscillibacter sp. CU971 TaxID=2780102 RepID=UPI0019584548|nr:ATP-binding cassette domain-containing protein [Oscillibacter sp. CU971]
MNVEIFNLSMTYPSGKTALRGIDLNLRSPNLIGLLGPNGAGKSTLMKLLVAGLLPTEGVISVDGKPLMKQERLLKARLGYLPQSFGLFDELTVWQFLDYMAALKGIVNSKEAIAAAIQSTNLEEKQKAKIRTLSGGQRQRVGIAQAILGNPHFLIFDEPTVGLDPEERISFRNLFSQMAQDRLVLLSTHIIEDVQSVCNQLIVIHQGRIRFAGTPAELIAGAVGHGGIFREKDRRQEAGLHITSRVNTAQGIVCRAVAEELPDFVEQVEPALEDAYLYLISREAMQ